MKRSYQTTLLIVLLIVAVIGLIYYYYFFSYAEPKVKLTEKSFYFADACGYLAGKLQHFVGDDGQCLSKCKAFCEQKGYVSYESNFSWGEEIACNNCTCSCYP